ncbi:MAG: hypothetical protein V9E81_10720 [Marmoricola sp.]
MWPVTSTRQVYTNPWIAVDEDIVTAPDGRPAQYGVVTMQHPAVFIVAVSEQDEVVLVRVNRHTTGIGWEVLERVAPMVRNPSWRLGANS